MIYENRKFYKLNSNNIIEMIVKNEDQRNFILRNDGTLEEITNEADRKLKECIPAFGLGLVRGTQKVLSADGSVHSRSHNYLLKEGEYAIRLCDIVYINKERILEPYKNIFK